MPESFGTAHAGFFTLDGKPITFVPLDPSVSKSRPSPGSPSAPDSDPRAAVQKFLDDAQRAVQELESPLTQLGVGEADLPHDKRRALAEGRVNAWKDAERRIVEYAAQQEAALAARAEELAEAIRISRDADLTDETALRRAQAVKVQAERLAARFAAASPGSLLELLAGLETPIERAAFAQAWPAIEAGLRARTGANRVDPQVFARLGAQAAAWLRELSLDDESPKTTALRLQADEVEQRIRAVRAARITALQLVREHAARAAQALTSAKYALQPSPDSVRVYNLMRGRR